MKVVVGRCGTGKAVRVELFGEISGAAAGRLRSILVQEAESMPARLLVDLGAVERIDFEIVISLMAGYNAAVEHGALYQIVGVRDQVRRTLERWQMLDVLTDSDDLGALIVAYCRLSSFEQGECPG